jgi:hypothetical protein
MREAAGRLEDAARARDLLSQRPTLRFSKLFPTKDTTRESVQAENESNLLSPESSLLFLKQHRLSVDSVHCRPKKASNAFYARHHSISPGLCFFLNWRAPSTTVAILFHKTSSLEPVVARYRRLTTSTDSTAQQQYVWIDHHLHQPSSTRLSIALPQ